MVNRRNDFNVGYRVWVVTMLIWLCVFAWGAGARDSLLTEQGLAQDPFLAKALYSVPERLASGIADDGAIGVNGRVGAGQQMFIEEQRYGGDMVQAGLATGDDALVRKGMTVIEWGFKQQAQDGSFPNTGDSF